MINELSWLDWVQQKVFFFIGSRWILHLLFWHCCFAWLGWQLLRPWRKLLWVFRGWVFLQGLTFSLTIWLIFCDKITKLLEFSFKSGENSVLSFFCLIGLFIGMFDVIVPEFIEEQLCWMSVVWEKFVISIELVGHSPFLN